MGKKIRKDSPTFSVGVRQDRRTKLSTERSRKLVETNPYLETQRNHKKWFAENTMGKQRKKPRYDLKEKKK